MNNNQTLEIDNSPTALYVKSWMKKDNPNLTQSQLEEKWLRHLEHQNQVAKTKGIKKS